MEIYWNMFGAGIALIGFTIMLFTLNGLLSTFRVQVRVPWFVPVAVFILGLLLLMQSIGLITNISDIFTYTVKNSNITELIVGLITVLSVAYKPLYEKISVKLSGWLRLTVFIFGVIMILDAVRAVPILYTLSQIIGVAMKSTAVFLTQYPWVAVFITLGVFILIGWMAVKLRGGVKA